MCSRPLGTLTGRLLDANGLELCFPSTLCLLQEGVAAGVVPVRDGGARLRASIAQKEQQLRVKQAFAEGRVFTYADDKVVSQVGTARFDCWSWKNCLVRREAVPRGAPGALWAMPLAGNRASVYQSQRC